MIPNSQFRLNSQFDPKCQTRTHIVSLHIAILFFFANTDYNTIYICKTVYQLDKLFKQRTIDLSTARLSNLVFMTNHLPEFLL